jgi:DNA topoisomerase-1
MSKLVIVESPSKAKTIEKYLGKDYDVEASVGHVRDLPKSNKNAVDIEAGFVPNYVISPRKKDVVEMLKKEAKKADGILLATDPDREGEAIAWHVAEALGLKEKDYKRIVFHEITKEAVQEAISHPRGIDQSLVRAQEARRVLDRLFGYDLSGLIWKKVRYGLSAGRVQSPALRILMEREREIRAFIPEEYFVLTAPSKANLPAQAGKEEFTLTCIDEPRERKEAERIKKIGEENEWEVKNVEEKKVKRNPYAPFTTSTLQQTASTRLGFSPSRTMRAAQKLYEKGHITYMRTDSTTLAKSALQMILKTVESNFGKNYIEARVFKTKSKSAQEAHEAVRPTNPNKQKAGNTDDEKNLYDLIWKRSISSQMKSAELLRTKITANVVSGETIPDFAVNGSQTIFDGWLKADPGARGEDTEVPKLKVGGPIEVKEVNVEDKETTPPPRYSEAGLVKELEKRGIGRPSTYASIIQTLQDRKYVDKEGRTLIPTDTGDVVSSFLEEHFTDYISDDFTAEMENELDEIAEGTREYEKTLKDFYVPFHKDVIKKEKEAGKITDLGEAPKEFPCPKCGAPMVIKLGKAGKFMSCSKFPDCEGARTIEGEEAKEPEALGVDPNTKQPVFVLDGPYGPYVQLGPNPDKSGRTSKKNEKGPKAPKSARARKPKRASIPQGKDKDEVTIEDALKYLSLPRTLGEHPETGEKIVANIGRFGPYIALQIKPKPDFRSLKEDDPYAITLERALEILAEPKKRRGFKKKESA